MTAPAAFGAPAPVYEIEGSWVNPPATVARGNPVVAEWRINVNDANTPPSNEPIPDVTATFSLGLAVFDEIPDICLVEGVTTPSSISEDGTTLTCNFGPVVTGTALVLQTPVIANGITGEEITMEGTSPGGETVVLPPIEILNTFAMDIHYGTNTNQAYWDDASDPTYVDVDVQWSLRLGVGSDPGPDEVTYQIEVTSNTGANVDLAPRADDPTELGCGPFNRFRADGHPWSELPNYPEHQQTSFVDECIITETGTPGVFNLTLRGINYDLANVPTHDSTLTNGTGNPLPPDWDYVASGSLYFRVHTSVAGSITLTTNAPTYTSPTGLTATDLTGNNTTNKTYTLPGGWASAWTRGFTGSGGTNWDDTYRVSPGTELMQHINVVGGPLAASPTSMWGNCQVLDTRFVTYIPLPEGELSEILGVDQSGGGGWDVLQNPPAIQYYVGSNALVDPNSTQYNPDQFDCGIADGGWTTTRPADLTTIKATRITYPHSFYAAEGWDGIQLRAYVQLHDDVPVGQDVWMFGSALWNGTWTGPERADTRIAVPDARYPTTTGRRDILRISTVTPHIEKEAARATVTPGVPADFTLTYSANGSGIVPDTVDDYEIVDTLPLGMTYQAGSASPEPVVSVDLQGRQVLTWTLDGVPTNTPTELTYQAVVDSSIEPGSQLTNTAVSSHGGNSATPVTETVTTATNGYTTILKTADVEFIPNQNGDGVGTGSWTVEIESRDPLPQAFTDTIDILPYVGDQRGTSFSGSYTLDEVVLNDGGTVYYTDADPTTLSDDPADPSNGTAGDIAGNTVSWSTERPENPTAIRVIGGELISGGSFSFQVVITTDGAQPQDVYVNQAQARAEHTDLVMRTSASLVVTDYTVAKSSDPESGSTVRPGDTITYTVLVTQEGPVPAGAWFTDDLSAVLDDADYNEDVAADIGTVSVEDGVLSWEGVVPVDGVATITYSVTVKDVAGLQADGDTSLTNVVTSPGCQGECTTEHVVGYFELSKTSEAAPGSVVQVGEVITYSILIEQVGEGAVAGASVVDDLTAVLDDATWNGDVVASAGEVSFEEPILTWSGDLAVGDVVELTYSVTVTAAGEGDDELMNVAQPNEWGVCVPAPDENPDCTTSHQVGDYEVVKTSDPVSGSEVEVGDVIEYTVTVTHIGIAPVAEATLEDDLTDVLDDATWNDDLAASAGEAAYGEPILTWAGPLELGEEVTLTYSVTVTAAGDRHLVNVVTTPGECIPAEGQDEACTTVHINGAYVFSKTADPESGSQVEAGDVITYTVMVEQVGSAGVQDAVVVDDLDGVLGVADWNDDAAASSGDLDRDGSMLTWTGDLEVDQVVTITYSVTVGDEPDATIYNRVTSPDPRGVCVPAADGNPDCETEHTTASAASAALPNTGTDGLVTLAVGGGILTLLGAALLLGIARRKRQQAEPTA